MNIKLKSVNSLVKIGLGLTLLGWMALSSQTILSALSPRAAAEAAAIPSEALPEFSAPVRSSFTGPVSDAGGMSRLVNRGPLGSVIEPQGRMLRVRPSSATPGSELTVPVEFFSQGDEREIRFSLRFDAAGLELLDARLAPGVTGASLDLDRSQAAMGVLGAVITLEDAGAFSGAHRLLDLSFRIDGGRERRTSEIEFTDYPLRRGVIDADGAELFVGYTNGVVAVAAAIEGDVAPRPNGSDDGALTIGDWIQAGRFMAQLDDPVEGSEFQRADTAPRATFGDGRITLADWVQVGRYTEGLDSPQPAAGPTAPVSFAGAAAAAFGEGASPAQVRTVRVVGTTFTRGQDNTIVIELDAQGNENAVSFTLNYNPQHISFVRVQLGDGVPVQGEPVLNTNTEQIAAGRIGVALALRGGRTFGMGVRQLLVVTFTVPTVGNQNTSVVGFGDEPIGSAVVNTNADEVEAAFLAGTVNFTPTVNAVPVITSISPSFVIVGGPTFTLIVNGMDFVDGAAVRVDGQIRATRFVSTTELQAFLPPGDIAEPGTIDISVLNPPPGGGVSNTVQLSINNPVPSILEVTPQVFGVGQAGVTITVIGSDFVSGAMVRWNGQARQTFFDNSSQLRAVIPTSDFAQAGTPKITVLNPQPGGGVSNEVEVTVRQASALPRISMLSPETRVPGDTAFTLTVIGTNFAPDAFVRWQGSPRMTTFISDTELEAQIPASDIAVGGNFVVSVVNPPPGGGNSNNMIFRVEGTANPAPQLTSISPNTVVSGGQDFTLTLNGAGFVGESVVLYNGQTRPTTFVSSTQLQATVFAADIVTSGTAQITVSTPPPGGGLSNAQTLTITLGPPTILFLSPNSALAGGDGFTLTVIGTSFINGAGVRWNGQARATTFVSGSELQAQIPASDIAAPGTAQVTVVQGNQTSNAANFFIQAESNPVPRINSLSPSTIIVGGPSFTMIVSGTGFFPGSIVRLNSSPRQTTYISATELQVQVPASDTANVGTIVVTVFNSVPGGGTSNAVNFAVTEGSQNPPVVTTITPSTVNAGGPGFTLAVEGLNFNPTSVVQVGSESRTTTFISSGQLTAQVTAADIAFGGTVTVNVFNPPPGGGTSNVVSLTVLNPTPVLTSLDPGLISTSGLGGGNTTVTINGSNFAPGVVVQVNGQNRPTGFVNSTRITVTVLASDRANEGDLTIVAVNAGPGGGASNALLLLVRTPNALPRITSITPESANAGAPGFTLVVTGTNFASNAVVRFGNRDLMTEVLSSTTATATVTSADLLLGGQVAVRIFNPPPGGGTSGVINFAINSPAPQLTSVSPAQLVGTGLPVTITVTGANFVGASVVRINGQDRPTTFLSTTQLSAVLQAVDLVGITSATISVFTPEPGGGVSNSIIVPVTPGQAPAPVITSLTPGAVIVGSGAITLTVDGANFVPTSSVRVNGVARATTFVSNTRLTIGLTAGDLSAVTTLVITVFTPAPGGGLSNALNFGVLAAPPPAPVITSLAPSSAAIGVPFVLTVNGANFTPTSVVQVNGSPRVTTFVSGTQLTAQITAADVASVAILTITVVTPAPGGGVSGGLPLTIQSAPNPAPTLVSLNPVVVTEGSGAFLLTINGANFVGGSMVRWNGLNQPTTFLSGTQVRAQISGALVASQGTALITVFNPGPGGGVSNTLIFLIDPAGTPDCRTICFRSAQYYVRNISRVPNGLVLIGGVNANTPILVKGNETLIRSVLQGGTSALQQLNAEFVASQLSFISAGSATAAGALQSSPRCYGIFYTPVLLSNGAVITPNTSINDIFTQIRSAISDNRTQDMPQLAAILLLLNGTDPFSTCNRPGDTVEPPSEVGESRLFNLQSRPRARREDGRIEIIEQ
ncbi:MAG: hypothetical protein KIT57_07205 [Blastocatellales bacterium]|nr:hypothetical protein [Blastocatellales bacterium]